MFLSTIPVAVPFIVMQDAMGAMRASNAVAVAMVALGGMLVALTIALGG